MKVVLTEKKTGFESAIGTEKLFAVLYCKERRGQLPQESYLQERKGIVKVCNTSKVRRFSDISEMAVEWQT